LVSESVMKCQNFEALGDYFKRSSHDPIHITAQYYNINIYINIVDIGGKGDCITCIV